MLVEAGRNIRYTLASSSRSLGERAKKPAVSSVFEYNFMPSRETRLCVGL